jgi:membrane associated rhomboid family serine protease
MNSNGQGLGRSIFSALLSKVSLVTWLILINLAVFIIELILLAVYPDSINYFALNAGNFLQGKYLWTLATHMFAHANFFHLFVNMFSLYFVGGFVEKIIGRKRFLWFYLASGIFAGIVSAVLAGYFGYGFWAKVFGSSETYMLGASGALFGLVGVLAVLVPRAKVYMIAGPLVAIVAQAILGLFVKSAFVMGAVGLAVNIYIILSIFMMFSFNPRTRKWVVPIAMPFWILPIVAIVPLVIIGLFVPLPIGNIAHFGGLLAGLAYGAHLMAKYKKKIVLLRKFIKA